MDASSPVRCPHLSPIRPKTVDATAEAMVRAAPAETITPAERPPPETEE